MTFHIHRRFAGFAQHDGEVQVSMQQMKTSAVEYNQDIWNHGRVPLA